MKNRQNKEPEPFKLPEVDLRSHTRDSDKINTLIYLKGFSYEDKQFLWIQCGSVEFRVNKDRDIYTLTAKRPDGMTDFEHDAAKSLSIPILGLRHVEGWGGHVRFQGHIDLNPNNEDELRVFWPDPAEEITTCTDCEKHHLIGNYLPDPSPDLFNKIRGMEVEIFIGPARNDKEED